MKPPSKFYRYRPLDDTLLTRELGALRDSYLFSPPFAAMNDPMEAFYETDGPSDRIIDAMLAPSGKSARDMYAIVTEEIDRFALVSFAGTHEDLPIWASYGSNFAGMCLEFDTVDLAIGDFQNESLRQVTYASSALPPLTMADIAPPERLDKAVIARITRKRSEWSHEKEWRFITGEVGPKALPRRRASPRVSRPRVKPEHATQVCEVLDRRPVEVLHGQIEGFELTFRSIKAARPLKECERVGAGRFDPAEDLRAEQDLREFLTVPFDALVEKCRRTGLLPNMEEFISIHITEVARASYTSGLLISCGVAARFPQALF